MLPSISFTRLGLSGLRSAARRTTAVTLPARQARSFASVLPTTPAVASVSAAPKAKLPGNVEDARQPGAVRPHLGVQVDPKHGLYAFFRKTEEKDGVTKYETVESLDFSKADTGRAWTAAELRRKSFKDLHTLWYVLLRERNLLATQTEEARRMGVPHNRLAGSTKVFRVRKSMARLKYVLNERRLAYEGAVEVFESKVKVRLLQREIRRQKHKAAMALLAEENARKEKELAAASATAEPNDEAANLAVAGLLETTTSP